MRRGLSALGVLGLALACGAAGYWSYRHVLTPRALQSAQASATEPPSAPPAPRVIPAMLPALQLPDINGVQKSLQDFAGRPLLINFWASWCAPCRREIPLLHTLRRAYAPDRLQIVGIAIDFQSAVKEFLLSSPIQYPVLVGEQAGLDAVQKFGMDPLLPFSVFADSRGQIVAVKVGELHRDEADAILSAMHAIEAGALDLPQAREQIAVKLKALSVARAKAKTPS